MGEVLLNRREMMALAAAGMATGAVARSELQANADRTSVPDELNHFVAEYLRTMNAPGLSLGLATRSGTIAAACYGYADLAAKTPALPTQLFQIGSITKSFAGLTVLQMQDEGKLDVQQPILRYLPWLPVETDYGDIRIHHLLTHTSGMPNQAPVIMAEPGARVRQGQAPGTQFHYSNWGYNVLGRLIEEIDDCSWPTAVARRLLLPLGMHDTVAAIDSSTRARIVQSYAPLHDDRPYPRRGPLAPAGNLNFNFASGSIAATARDMGSYMQMILNRGAGPSGRVLSQESFALFATGHIDAPDFGPGARYGYGIAVDQLEGRTRLRHTGGMPSFMSSMQLDLDGGVGAFASINAYQGYRPNAVTLYALRLLHERGHTIAVPPLDEWAALENASEYAGVYVSPDGRKLEVIAEGERLMLSASGRRIPLQHRGGDEFLADHEDFALFPLTFGRQSGGSRRAVSELSHGSQWYAHARYDGDRLFELQPQLAPYPGLYRPDDASLFDMARIVERRGQLWLDGTTRLESLGGQRFRLAGEPGICETAEFRCIVDGQAGILLMNGHVLRRASAHASS